MTGSYCPRCDIHYAYVLPHCSFCGGDLEPHHARPGVVLASTQVDAPSVGHEDVPYWCALVQDDDGCLRITKSDRVLMDGDPVAGAGQDTATAYTIGILGSGVMARGLVELLLARGHTIVWHGRDKGRLTSSSERVAERLGRGMDAKELDQAMGRLSVSEAFGDLRACDLVIEAVVENLDVKREVLHNVEQSVDPGTIIATNTSSLPLAELSDSLIHPERFGGLHFFNPPTRMRLVETIVGPATDERTSLFLDAFAADLGKVPIRVGAGPGFVVNRVLMPLLNEAVRALEEGIADAHDIDEAVRLGLNHPMGPLALADLIGIDVVVSIMRDLEERLGDDAYTPRPTLLRMVDEGRLGKKTGLGFYEYVGGVPLTG